MRTLPEWGIFGEMGQPSPWLLILIGVLGQAASWNVVSWTMPAYGVLAGTVMLQGLVVVVQQRSSGKKGPKKGSLSHDDEDADEGDGDGAESKPINKDAKSEEDEQKDLKVNGAAEDPLKVPGILTKIEEDDRLKRACRLVHDLKREQLGYNLLIQAGHEDYFRVYDLFENKAWQALVITCICMPILFASWEPAINPGYQYLVGEVVPENLLPVLWGAEAMCLLVVWVNLGMECKLKGGVKALFKTSVPIRAADGTQINCRNTHNKIQLASAVLLFLLSVTLFVRIGGESFYLLRCLRPLLLITHLQSFYRLVALITRTAVKVKHIFLFLSTIVLVFSLLGIVLFGHCDAVLTKQNLTAGAFLDISRTLRSLFVLISADNMGDLIQAELCESNVSSIFIMTFVVIAQIFVINLMVVDLYEEYNRAHRDNEKSVIQREEIKAEAIFDLLATKDAGSPELKLTLVAWQKFMQKFSAFTGHSASNRYQGWSGSGKQKFPELFEELWAAEQTAALEQRKVDRALAKARGRGMSSAEQRDQRIDERTRSRTMSGPDKDTDTVDFNEFSDRLELLMDDDKLDKARHEQRRSRSRTFAQTSNGKLHMYWRENISTVDYLSEEKMGQSPLSASRMELAARLVKSNGVWKQRPRKVLTYFILFQMGIICLYAPDSAFDMKDFPRDTINEIVDITNLVFLFTHISEMLLKLYVVASWPRFKKINGMDFTICCAAAGGTCVQLVRFANKPGLSQCRFALSLPILRIFLVTKAFKGLMQLMVKVVVPFLDLGALLVVGICFYAILGMDLFQGKFLDPNVPSFNTPFGSMVTLFQLFLDEGNGDIMEHAVDMYDCTPSTCYMNVTTGAAAFLNDERPPTNGLISWYFVSYKMITIIIYNLFVGVVLHFYLEAKKDLKRGDVGGKKTKRENKRILREKLLKLKHRPAKKTANAEAGRAKVKKVVRLMGMARALQTGVRKASNFLGLGADAPMAKSVRGGPAARSGAPASDAFQNAFATCVCRSRDWPGSSSNTSHLCRSPSSQRTFARRARVLP